MAKLYGYVSNMGAPEYDDILNSDLPKEEKVKQIQMRGQAYNDELDRDYLKNMARIGLGTLISGASMHPILNIPYIGTGLGGAMYDAGQAIVEGDNLGDIAKRAGRGFAIGETVGAVPYVGKYAGKTKAGQAVGQQFDKVAQKVAANPAVQKAYDVLMTDVKAFNPNKQTVYHGSPYDFEKFSNEAIGTGEGAQAHGMGHYAALNKDVAEEYRKRLSESLHNEKIQSRLWSDLKNDRIPQLNDNEEKELFEYIANNITPSEFNAEHLKNYFFKDLETPEAKEFAKNLLENMAENNNIKTGQLYKLSVPKDDVMLREDLPINQQPIMANIFNNEQNKTINGISKNYHNFLNTNEALGIDTNKVYGTKYSSEAYNKFLENPENYKELYYPSSISGKDFYADLSNSLGGQKNASAELSKYGIKGISYNGGIDGEARVIFNPDDIDIVRKYYNQPSLADKLQGRTNTGALGDYLVNGDAPPKGFLAKKDILNSFEKFRTNPNLKELKLSNVRKDLQEIAGSNDIYLLQGDEKGGMKHILSKHPEDIEIVADTLKNGSITKVVPNRKVFIESKDGHCIVSLDYNGEKKTWLLTGYSKNKR